MKIRVSAKAKKTESQPLRFAFATRPAAKKLVAWYHRNERALPWRQLFKKHRDPYHVWISEIMLQQTVIKAVIPAYDRFLKAYPTVKKLAATDEESLRLVVRGLGYYRRFGFLLKAARVIVDDYGGRFPVTYDEWVALPGIGDYTASAISSIAFGERAAVVDGNVERVFCRLLDVRKPPNLPELKKIFKGLAQEFIDDKHPGCFNQALMELGQRVCTLGKPDCGFCPLQEGCLAFARKSQHLAPAAKLKKEMVDLQLKLHVFSHKKKIGLIRRPEDARFLKGTRGFLTFLAATEGLFSADGTHSSVFKMPVKRLKNLGVVKHNITHHRISADVLMIDAVPDGVDWLRPEMVEENLVSNLDRKAWRLIEKSKVLEG